MDRFQSMSTFVAVIEAGGFSAAARQLGVPLATVSRKVSELEHHLRASLIKRSPRKIALTEAGEAYYERCRRLLDDLGEAERLASGEYTTPRGGLVITAPVMFGRMHLTPVVVAFLKAYPEVDIRLMLDDAFVPFSDLQIDLAVRVQLPDSSLVARQFGSIRRVICASPSYLAANGTPMHPDDLTQHNCIIRSRSAIAEIWPFRVDGLMKEITLRRHLVVATADSAIAAALVDGGLIRVFDYQVADYLSTGKLVPVLQEYALPALPISLVYPAIRLMPLKLRAFLDFALPKLKQCISQTER